MRGAAFKIMAASGELSASEKRLVEGNAAVSELHLTYDPQRRWRDYWGSVTGVT